jgi:hypothetical protein
LKFAQTRSNSRNRARSLGTTGLEGGPRARRTGSVRSALSGTTASHRQTINRCPLQWASKVGSLLTPEDRAELTRRLRALGLRSRVEPCERLPDRATAGRAVGQSVTVKTGSGHRAGRSRSGLLFIAASIQDGRRATLELLTDTRQSGLYYRSITKPCACPCYSAALRGRSGS